MIRGDARHLPIRDACVAAVVTSPPYNTAAGYTAYDDALEWTDYWNMAYEAMVEIERVLMPGGRCWLNIQPTVPLIPRARDRKSNVQGRGREARVDLLKGWACAAEDAGLLYRDTVTWIQDAWDGQAAWGSWVRPSAPNLRGGWEAVLLMYKNAWKRNAPRGYEEWDDERMGLGGDWAADLTRNVWKIPTRRDRTHVAVFPDDLAARCIRLSTWPGEVVLDPFAGSGTTARVAAELGRRGVGVDVDAGR